MESQYKYVLKVAEELLKNACPPELLSKYEKLKQISFSQSLNQLRRNNSKSSFESAQPIQSHLRCRCLERTNKQDQFCVSMMESVMESVGLFLDVLQAINSSSNSEDSLRSLTREIGQFKELTNQILQDKQEDLRLNQPFFNKNVYSLDNIIKNMVKQLFHLEEYLRQQQLFQIQANKCNFSQQQSINNLMRLQAENDELRDQAAKITEINKNKIDCLQNELNENQFETQQLLDMHQQCRDSLQAEQERNHLIIEQHIQKQHDDWKQLVMSFEDKFGDLPSKHSQIYQDFIKEQNPQENQRLQLFVEFLLNKFERDNVWLIESLSEISKENLCLQNENTQWSKKNSLMQDYSNNIEMSHNKIALEMYYSAPQFRRYSLSQQKLKVISLFYLIFKSSQQITII